MFIQSLLDGLFALRSLIQIRNMDNQAALLLKTLNRVAEESGTELSIITPAINTFIEKTEEINTKLVGTINETKRTFEDHDDLVTEVLNFEITGSKGKLANYLRSFAMNGAWTVYGQQYTKKKNKIPIILQESVLRKMVFVRNKIQEQMDNDCDFTSDMDDLIKGFQYALVDDVRKFMNVNAGKVDFKKHWKEQAMSFEILASQPLKYHITWKFFFTDRTKQNIPRLVSNIEQALVYYRRNLEIQNRKKTNNTNIDITVQEAETVRDKGAGFLRREGEIKLLRYAKEQAGDSVDTIDEADKLNVDQFKTETDVGELVGYVDDIGEIPTDKQIEKEIVESFNDHTKCKLVIENTGPILDMMERAAKRHKRDHQNENNHQVTIKEQLTV